MAHHRRGRAKNQRAGCLLCKPHKANGAKGGGRARTRQDIQHDDLTDAQNGYDGDWDYPYWDTDDFYDGAVDLNAPEKPRLVWSDIDIKRLRRAGKTSLCPACEHVDPEHSSMWRYCDLCGGFQMVREMVAVAYRLGGDEAVADLSPGP